MRKIAGLYAVFISIMLVAPCFAASLPPVTNGLVGCWKFDEGSGVTAVDSSGSGNSGSIVNATYTGDDIPPQVVSGYSLIFNTTTAGLADSYVIIPDSPSLRPNSSLTLAAWVKTNVVQSRPAVIIGKQYGSPLYDSYCLWYEWGNLNFYLKTSTNDKYISIAQPPTNEWHHVVGTYDGSLMRLYVDGVERVNGAFTGSIVYDNLPLSIGADSDRADHALHQGWDGLIDEVLVYNRALSQAEILQVGNFPKVAAPTFNPPGGNYSSSQNVSLGCATSGATIRYTTDGSEPSVSSTVYSSPVLVNSTTTIKAKAFMSGMTDSDTAAATYTITEESFFGSAAFYIAVVAVAIVVVVIGVLVYLRKRRKVTE